MSKRRAKTGSVVKSPRRLLPLPPQPAMAVVSALALSAGVGCRPTRSQSYSPQQIMPPQTPPQHEPNPDETWGPPQAPQAPQAPQVAPQHQPYDLPAPQAPQIPAPPPQEPPQLVPTPPQAPQIPPPQIFRRAPPPTTNQTKAKPPQVRQPIENPATPNAVLVAPAHDVQDQPILVGPFDRQR